MTPRDPVLFLHDMLDCAQFLQSQLPGKTLDDYRSDRLLRSAVQRELTVIGEALYTLNKSHPAIAQSFDEHQAIITFRHILVHGYHTLDATIVWNVVTDKLSPLIEQLKARIAELDPPQSQDSTDTAN